MRYLKLIFFLIILLFIYVYTNKLIKYSINNNAILEELDKYEKVNNRYCIEGSINENGIILGLDGIILDKEKSFSNMKGSFFQEELLVFKKDECILNRHDNLDKLIISANKEQNNVTIIIDVINNKYYKKMIEIFDKTNTPYNLMVNDYYEGNVTNLIYKGNNVSLFEGTFCAYYDENILSECKKYGFNTIRITNYIENNLFSNIKKILNKGSIIFIKESSKNLNELEITINYIKSRGYTILNLEELLS